MTLPPAGFVIVTTTVVTAALALRDRVGLGLALPLLPAVYAAACVSVALGVVALKWLVIGRYQPFERPLWNPAIWRLEFVNALYEFLVSPLLLEPLQGTPFLPWYLRLLGARIGRRTYLHTTGFLEWDLVEIGDEAMVNEDCVLQTHLFEDRVLKAARLRIGRGCEVGALSVVLYDTALKPHAEYLFARFHPTPIEKGLHEFYDRPEVPLVQFVDGGSSVAEARTFVCTPSDPPGRHIVDRGPGGVAGAGRAGVQGPIGTAPPQRDGTETGDEWERQGTRHVRSWSASCGPRSWRTRPGPPAPPRCSRRTSAGRSSGFPPGPRVATISGPTCSRAPRLRSK